MAGGEGEDAGDQADDCELAQDCVNADIAGGSIN